VFNNIKVTLYYSFYMRTPSEKVRISDEAERVQSVSFSHMRSFSRLYTAVCLREGKWGTCLWPPFATLMCKIPCFQRGPSRPDRKVAYPRKTRFGHLCRPSTFVEKVCRCGTGLRSGRFGLSRLGHGTFRSWSFRSRDISVRIWNLAEILHVDF